MVPSIWPWGSSVGTNNSFLFSRPKRGEIDEQVVFVGQGEVNLRDLRSGFEGGFAHLEQGYLHRRAEVFSERREHGGDDLFVRAAVKLRGVLVNDQVAFSLVAKMRSAGFRGAW